MNRNLFMDRNVIQGICELLPTIEEGLYYMSGKLGVLEIENGIRVFQDIVGAIKSVFAHLVDLGIGNEATLASSIKDMRIMIGRIVDLYEQGILIEAKRVLDEYLIPRYGVWKHTVLEFITGDHFRYLQN